MKLDLPPIINLLHRADYGTLATQSVGMPGYPYATVVPNILDAQHRPLLLVSALAEHTRNLLADPKVSLSVADPGNGNVQDGRRLTLVGDVEQMQADAALTARYLRYLPAAKDYLPLDFMFFRIAPRRVRYIGGVGRMGWVEGEALRAAPGLSLAEETTLLQAAQALAPGHVTLLGIDPFGIDYLADDLRRRFELHAGEFSRDAVLASVPGLT